MKLLKENYEGLHEFVGLSEQLKKLLSEPKIQEALQKSDFDTLYKKLQKTENYDTIGNFTQLLISSNIDPLSYLDSIPIGFLTNTPIKHIDIPTHITRISDYAFYHCYELTDIIIPNHVKRIGKWAFSDCQKLTSITIPDSVKSISDEAFSNCSGLTSVTIGNRVTSISDWAFSRCIGLTGITIPDSVTSIGKAAFFACTGLTSVTIPNSVTSIGYWTFYGCTGLNYISYKGTKDQWGKIALTDEWDDSSSIKAIHCIDGDITL